MSRTSRTRIALKRLKKGAVVLCAVGLELVKYRSPRSLWPHRYGVGNWSQGCGWRGASCAQPIYRNYSVLAFASRPYSSTSGSMPFGVGMVLILVSAMGDIACSTTLPVTIGTSQGVPIFALFRVPAHRCSARARIRANGVAWDMISPTPVSV